MIIKDKNYGKRLLRLMGKVKNEELREIKIKLGKTV